MSKNRRAVHWLRQGNVPKQSLSPLNAVSPRLTVEDNEVFRVDFEVAGKPMSFETGKIGRQADGAVMARTMDTMIYSTACYQKEATPVDFTPLRVDYFARYRYSETICNLFYHG